VTGAVRVEAVVFDLGGVLIEWDPRHIYRDLLDTDEEIEAFLDEIGFARWTHAMDAGQGTWADAVAELTERYPHRGELIAAYPARFGESLAGPVEGSEAVLRELHARGVPLLALTNWSAETFPVARDRFAFLDLFDGIVVSGHEGVAKPDLALYELLVQRYGLDPGATVFVDDRQVNVDAARAAGLHGLLFTDADRLRADLTRLGLLDGAAPG
jgi:2-haloacid dehalogenase